MSNPNIILIEPHEFLRFIFAVNTPITSAIHLRNDSTQVLAFKIKTTSPKSYYVRPSQGLLNPNEFITIQIIVHPMPEFPANNRDKFLINYAITRLHRNSSTIELTKFWDSASKGMEAFLSAKLTAHYLYKDMDFGVVKESYGDGNEVRQQVVQSPKEVMETEEKVKMFVWVLALFLILGLFLLIVL